MNDKCEDVLDLYNNREYVILNKDIVFTHWSEQPNRGVLLKRYGIVDGKVIFMDKPGRFTNGEFEYIEPVMEVINYEIAKYLEIDCAKYELVIDDVEWKNNTYKDILISRTEWFLRDGEVEIKAREMFKVGRFKEEIRKSDIYSTIVKTFPNEIENINNMIVFDYLTAGSDRHTENFGFIKSGEVIRMAPIYDNGTCSYINSFEESDFIDDDMNINKIEDINIKYNDENFTEYILEITGIDLDEHLDDNFECKFLGINHYHAINRVKNTSMFVGKNIDEILNIVDKYSVYLPNIFIEIIKYSLNKRYNELIKKFNIPQLV